MEPVHHPLTINLGVTKTGTTSLHEYFVCNGWRSAHWRGCGTARRFCASAVLSWLLAPFDATEALPTSVQRRLIGRRANASANEASLRAEVGGVDVVAELNLQTGCIFPQVSHLFALTARLSRACFVLTTRPVESWLRSVRGHSNDLLGQLIADCPISPKNETGLARWYSEHVARAAEVLHRRPCAAVIDVEDPAAGKLLSRTFPGTDSRCWGHHNRAKAPRRHNRSSTYDPRLTAVSERYPVTRFWGALRHRTRRNWPPPVPALYQRFDWVLHPAAEWAPAEWTSGGGSGGGGGGSGGGGGGGGSGGGGSGSSTGSTNRGHGASRGPLLVWVYPPYVDTLLYRLYRLRIEGKLARPGGHWRRRGRGGHGGGDDQNDDDGSSAGNGALGRVLVLAGEDTLLSNVSTETIRRLRRWFGRVFFEAKDVDLEGVHTMPIGLQENYMRAHNVGQMQRAIGLNTREPTAMAAASFAAPTPPSLAAAPSASLSAVPPHGVARGIAASNHSAPSDHSWPPFERPRDVLGAWGSFWPLLNVTIASRRQAGRLCATRAHEAWLTCATVPRERWWAELAKYRFLLSPTGRGVQSPKTFEAMLAGTIPICQATPAALELRGAGWPLVVVSDWEEIIDGARRDAWWRELAPRLHELRAQGAFTIDTLMRYLTQPSLPLRFPPPT